MAFLDFYSAVAIIAGKDLSNKKKLYGREICMDKIKINARAG